MSWTVVFRRIWPPGRPKKLRRSGDSCTWLMTRAKDELDLVVSHRFYIQAKFGDGHVYASISRFIPSSIRNSFDCQHRGERAPGPATAAKKSGPATDVPAAK